MKILQKRDSLWALLLILGVGVTGLASTGQAKRDIPKSRRSFSLTSEAGKGREGIGLSPRQSGISTESGSGVESGLHLTLPPPFVRLPRKIAFREGYIIGYTWGSAIIEKSSGATLKAEAGYRFVVVEIEYTSGPVALYPPWFDEILLSTETKSHLWFGWPMRSKLVTGLVPTTFSPIRLEKDKPIATITPERYPAYIGLPYHIELSANRIMLRFRDEYTEVLTIDRQY